MACVYGSSPSYSLDFLAMGSGAAATRVCSLHVGNRPFTTGRLRLVVRKADRKSMARAQSECRFAAVACFVSAGLLGVAL